VPPGGWYLHTKEVLKKAGRRKEQRGKEGRLPVQFLNHCHLHKAPPGDTASGEKE